MEAEVGSMEPEDGTESGPDSVEPTTMEETD